MATKKLAAPAADNADFVSLKDAAYNQAAGYETATDTLTDVARFVRLHHPDYPTVKDEVVDNMLAEGYLLKLSETKRGAPRQFGYVDGNYVDVTQLAHKPKSVDVLTIAYATSLSNYDYRQLDNLDKKAIVRDIREMASTYISQSKARLFKKLEEIDNPDKAREKKRADNKTFRQHWEDLFSKGDAKVKLAVKHGDPDADVARYNAAVAAFWKVMNKQ